MIKSVSLCRNGSHHEATMLVTMFGQICLDSYDGDGSHHIWGNCWLAPPLPRCCTLAAACFGRVQRGQAQPPPDHQSVVSRAAASTALLLLQINFRYTAPQWAPVSLAPSSAQWHHSLSRTDRGQCGIESNFFGPKWRTYHERKRCCHHHLITQQDHSNSNSSSVHNPPISGLYTGCQDSGCISCTWIWTPSNIFCFEKYFYVWCVAAGCWAELEIVSYQYAEYN